MIFIFNTSNSKSFSDYFKRKYQVRNIHNLRNKNNLLVPRLRNDNIANKTTFNFLKILNDLLIILPSTKMDNFLFETRSVLLQKYSEDNHCVKINV